MSFRGKDSDLAVTKMSVAANRKRDKDVTDWFNVVAWGRLGEICQEYLSKGRLVFIEGRLQTDRYEQEDEVRYFTKVIALQMQMLDRRPEEKEPVTEEEPVLD